ncbi:MAG: DUF4442 domain-containing protein [Bacteroidetes bacterium]|nr:DUF4442 domain-containing protein [Bacteroidota bacterium]
MNLNSLLEKAKTSGFYKWLFNIVLWRTIPFNQPHRLKVEQVKGDALLISIPFIRKNKNHINGIHACALATLCEYISGLSLARALPPEQYRLILKSIQMEYLYQGKMKVNAEFGIDQSELVAIKAALVTEDSIVKTYAVQVFDTHQHHICTGSITWQIKPWGKVKSPSS